MVQGEEGPSPRQGRAGSSSLDRPPALVARGLTRVTVLTTAPGFIACQMANQRPVANREAEDRRLGVLTGVPAMGLDRLGSASYGPKRRSPSWWQQVPQVSAISAR